MGWVMPVTSDRIVEVSGDTITFQSLFIAEGHSGGALLTEDEEVVGLIQAHQPPFGRARAIGTVLDTVKSWGYPVAVHRAGAAHGTLDPPGDLNGLRDLLIAGGCAIAGELDDLGYTPLQEASMRGNRAAVALLLEHGADVNQRGTHRGDAPALSFATSHPDIVSLLLKAGANVDQTDRSGDTALFEAARNKSPESVRRLLSAGAEVNRANDRGETPLFLAVRRSDVESVRLLLGAGARVNVPTGDGETPLSLVEGGRSKEEQELYKLLIAKGAVR
jgi:ankyrin repeat protein